jgi:hypothetical protein
VCWQKVRKEKERNSWCVGLVRIVLSSPHECVSSDTRRRLGHSTRQSKGLLANYRQMATNGLHRTPKHCQDPGYCTAHSAVSQGSLSHCHLRPCIGWWRTEYSRIHCVDHYVSLFWVSFWRGRAGCGYLARLAPSSATHLNT